MVNAPLQDAASVTMSSNLHTVGCNSVVDKLVKRNEVNIYRLIVKSVTCLIVFWRQLIQALLDNVIPVQVLDENNNV